jgi:hypothetical protein
MTAFRHCSRCGQVKAAEQFYRRCRGRRLSSYCRPCTQAASRKARTKRRQDPAVVELLRAADRIRQHRHRALGRQGGDSR